MSISRTAIQERPAAYVGADHVFGQQRHDHHHGQHEQVFALGCIEGVAEDFHFLRGDDAGGAVIGQPADLGQAPHHEELRGQRGGGQVKAADA
jgi:hypothetical protein